MEALRTPPTTTSTRGAPAVVYLGRVLDELKRHVRGEVLVPGDAPFLDTARVFNAARQHTPRAIVRCLDTADVVTVMKLTAQHGVPVTVRSGGHSISGASVGEGAVVIDLRRIAHASLDESSGVVTVGGGIISRDANAFAWSRGRCLSTGFEPRVGLSGALLGGGYGLCARKYGLACDALLEAEVVLADGTVVMADAARESDLFWALRGAGAHFGVVTRFSVRSFPLPTLSLGTATFAVDGAERIFQRYRELLPTLGRDTMLYLTMSAEEELGPVIQALGFHFGGEASAKQVLAPALNLGRPLLKSVEQVPFEAVHQVGSVFPEQHRHAWSAHFFSSAGAATDELARFAQAELRFPFWVVCEHLGGAVSDVAPDATAFPFRSVELGLVTALRWTDAAPTQQLAAQRQLHDALSPRALGTYANYVSDGRFAVAYGANLERLRALKEKYDPSHRFGAALGRSSE